MKIKQSLDDSRVEQSLFQNSFHLKFLAAAFQKSCQNLYAKQSANLINDIDLASTIPT